MIKLQLRRTLQQLDEDWALSKRSFLTHGPDYILPFLLYDAMCLNLLIAQQF